MVAAFFVDNIPRCLSVLCHGVVLLLQGPRCSLRSKKMYSDAYPDYLRMTALNVPAALLVLGVLFSIDDITGAPPLLCVVPDCDTCFGLHHNPLLCKRSGSASITRGGSMPCVAACRAWGLLNLINNKYNNQLIN
jgi:hypothetical protein